MSTKQFIFCLLAIIFAACTSNYPESQDTYLSRSFKWEVKTVVEDGLTYSETITIGGDTLIDGKTYRLVKNYYPMRQTKNRIYMYDYSEKKEILLYDFSMQVGDSIAQLADPYLGIPTRFAKVSKTEIIKLADGRNARRIEYEQKYPGPRNSDIEFVGNEQCGILGPLNNIFREMTLEAFYDNNTLLFPVPLDCYGEMQLLNNLEEPTDEYACLLFLDNYGTDFQTAYENLQPEIDDMLQEIQQSFQSSTLWDASKIEIRLTKRNVINSPKQDVEYISVDFYMFNISPSNRYVRVRVFRVIDSNGNVYNVSYR